MESKISNKGRMSKALVGLATLLGASGLQSRPGFSAPPPKPKDPKIMLAAQVKRERRMKRNLSLTDK